MSPNYKIIAAVVVLGLLLCLVESKAMPVKQGPRIIRTPYRNREISMARGYGKRDVSGYAYDYDERRPVSDEYLSDSPLGDPKGRNGWEKLYPLSIDWLANELVANPKVLKAFLSKFFDANKDGKISVKELLGNAMGANEFC